MSSPRPDVVETICDRLSVSAPRCGRVRVVAVDGGAGSGKTSLAEAVQSALAAAGLVVHVVHTDDLIDGWTGQTTFWPRLRDGVLARLASGAPGSYRRYDWHAARFADEVEVAVPDVLVVEGVSAIAACGEFAALTVFLDVDRGERERRWAHRAGVAPQHPLDPTWRAWLDAEDRFFTERPAADVEVRADELAQPPALRRLAGREVYANPWMAVWEDQVQFADGSSGVYGTVRKDDFVLVLPESDGGFWLVEQYRYAVRSRHWEFCQGGWSPGRSGTARELAAAELAEEVGARAAELTHLGRLFAAYGYSGQSFDVFLATGLELGPPDREVSEQDMRLAWFTESKVRSMVADGRLRDAHSVAALTLLDLHRRTPRGGGRSGPGNEGEPAPGNPRVPSGRRAVNWPQ